MKVERQPNKDRGTRPGSSTLFLEEPADLRWPRKGDRLLQTCQESKEGARFSNDSTSRNSHIWDGNMTAGAILIGACEEDSYQGLTLIYPILFNYRHAIELAMKWIIEKYGRLSTARVGDFKHHDLWTLWHLCKRIIVELGSEDEAIPAVEQIIKDFHDLDSSGQAFRYADSKARTPLLLPDYPIDLTQTRDVMQGLAHFFEGVDAQLDDAKQAFLI